MRRGFWGMREKYGGDMRIAVIDAGEAKNINSEDDKSEVRWGY
jgi:hypothetical protein